MGVEEPAQAAGVSQRHCAITERWASTMAVSLLMMEDTSGEPTTDGKQAGASHRHTPCIDPPSPPALWHSVAAVTSIQPRPLYHQAQQ
jgi:hypothetical protein